MRSTSAAALGLTPQFRCSVQPTQRVCAELLIFSRIDRAQLMDLASTSLSELLFFLEESTGGTEEGTNLLLYDELSCLLS